jgi:hypothetical protein
VKDQVKASESSNLALWCGNNEVDEAIVNWGYQTIQVFKRRFVAGLERL